MLRFEKKLAEWKAIYDQASAAGAKLRQLKESCSDAEAIRRCADEANRLAKESEQVLQELHRLLGAAKKL